MPYRKLTLTLSWMRCRADFPKMTSGFTKLPPKLVQPLQHQPPTSTTITMVTTATKMITSSAITTTIIIMITTAAAMAAAAAATQLQQHYLGAQFSRMYHPLRLTHPDLDNLHPRPAATRA